MSLTSFLEAPERDLCKPTKDFNGLQGTMLLLARNSILHFEGFTGRPLPPGSTNYIMGGQGRRAFGAKLPIYGGANSAYCNIEGG